ncbi:MAG TPA: M36 family metallopeptidase, partial [Rubricoccaceae bacterium]
GPAGNQVALSLVTEALRLTPCRPGFVSARDAILQADGLLYGGAHTPLLWSAFARRGLGAGASQGSAATNADNVENFGTPTGPRDAVPPGRITDLAFLNINVRSVALRFTAPGDDGAAGQLQRYEVRYSGRPIVNDDDFRRASRFNRTALPVRPGAQEAFEVTGLVPDRTYYFAVRGVDEAYNLGPLSNVIVGWTTQRPVLVPAHDSLVVSVVTGGQATVSLSISNLGATGMNGFVQLGYTADAAGPFGYAVASTPGGGPGGEYTPLGDAGAALRDWTPHHPGTPATDDGFALVPLPFAFPFDGGLFSNVYVHSNGLLSFRSGVAAMGAPPSLGSPDLPNAVVAPFWADLSTEPPATVSVGRLGDGPFVIEYEQALIEGTGERASFHVSLFPSGAVDFHYGAVPPNVPGLVRGLESVDGNLRVRLPGSPRDGARDRLVLVSQVLRLRDTILDLPPGGADRVDLTVNATGLAPGRYLTALAVTNVYVTTRDTLRVPVVLDVTARKPEDGGPPPDEPPPAPVEAPPPAVELRSPRPNPLRVVTRLPYGLPSDADVRLAVYDVRGREVAVLAEGAHEAGWHEAVWEPGGAAAGLYVARLVVGGEVRAVRLVVTR